jgi:hypothetical protein
LAEDLGAAKAPQAKASAGQVELSRVVVLEGLSTPVEAVAADFDESRSGPEEVDRERADGRIDPRLRDSMLPADREEPALCLATGVIGDDLSEVEVEEFGLADGLAH